MTRWFLTHRDYETWRDTLPVEEQINTDLYVHVGHTSIQFQPNSCIACAMNLKLMEQYGQEPPVW